MSYISIFIAYFCCSILLILISCVGLRYSAFDTSAYTGWRSGSRRRSFAGGLPVIYAWSLLGDMWPLRGQGVRYGSANQTNSAFYSFGVDKWV